MSDVAFGETSNSILDNRLYRVQIYDGGGGYSKSDASYDKATIIWSDVNASTAFSIKNVSEFEVTLNPLSRNLDNVFKVGDLVEIADDIDDLSEQPRGQLRRLTGLDLSNEKMSWKSSSRSDQSGITYLHDPLPMKIGKFPRYQPENHLKLIKWNGIKYVNSKEMLQDGSISLDDSSTTHPGMIRIRFEPRIFQSGLYWMFTTRGVVEKLRSAQPNGPRHDYAPLALIRKETGSQIKIIKDLRHSFKPVTDLNAVDINYEDGSQSADCGKRTRYKCPSKSIR